MEKFLKMVFYVLMNYIGAFLFGEAIYRLLYGQDDIFKD